MGTLPSGPLPLWAGRRGDCGRGLPSARPDLAAVHPTRFPVTDLGAFALFSALLLAAVGVGEGLRAFAGWRPEATRRVVHAGVGVATALCPPLFSSPALVYVLAVGFVAANAIALRARWLPAIHGAARPSLGTVLFPAALVGALYLCWTLDPSRVFILQTAFLVLGLADPAASLGRDERRQAGPVHRRRGDEIRRRVAAFAAVAAACTAGMLAWLAPWSAAQIASGALVVAAVGAACEASGRNGWDNVLIVLAVVVPLAALDARPEAAGLFAVAVVAGASFGWAAFRARSLDLSGALAGGVLAFGLVAVGGVAWAVPSLAFFVGSSALSRLGRSRKADAEALAEKGSRRDAAQVASNGGVAAALLAATVFWPAHAAPALRRLPRRLRRGGGRHVGDRDRDVRPRPDAAPRVRASRRARRVRRRVACGHARRGRRRSSSSGLRRAPFGAPVLAVVLGGVAGAFVDTALGRDRAGPLPPARRHAHRARSGRTARSPPAPRPSPTTSSTARARSSAPSLPSPSPSFSDDHTLRPSPRSARPRSCSRPPRRRSRRSRSRPPRAARWASTTDAGARAVVGRPRRTARLPPRRCPGGLRRSRADSAGERCRRPRSRVGRAVGGPRGGARPVPGPLLRAQRLARRASPRGCRRRPRATSSARRPCCTAR